MSFWEIIGAVDGPDASGTPHPPPIIPSRPDLDLTPRGHLGLDPQEVLAQAADVANDALNAAVERKSGEDGGEGRNRTRRPTWRPKNPKVISQNTGSDATMIR